MAPRGALGASPLFLPAGSSSPVTRTLPVYVVMEFTPTLVLLLTATACLPSFDPFKELLMNFDNPFVFAFALVFVLSVACGGFLGAVWVGFIVTSATGLFPLGVLS